MCHPIGLLTKYLRTKNDGRKNICWMPRGVNIAYYVLTMRKPTYLGFHQKMNIYQKNIEYRYRLCSKKYDLLFGGTLGTLKTKPVDIELQHDKKP